MRHVVIGLVLVGLAFAGTAEAQHQPGPPNAGTPLVCCTSWTVSVVPGWPLPYDGPPPLALSIPEAWPVTTLVAIPDAPGGDSNTYWVPGTATRMIVWDPAESIHFGKSERITPIRVLARWPFPLSFSNAVGGQFQAGGFASTFHAGHLPDVVKVYVQMADGSRTRDMTVRIQ
jgi:hypothetical protein